MNNTNYSGTTVPVSFDAQPGDDSAQYAYRPTLWVAAMFIGLFGFSTLLHIAQAVYYRVWWMFPTAILAGFGEVLGWVGRVWSSKNLSARDPFMMSITTQIISPTPLLAASFIILGRIIRRLGPEYSRLSPRWYTIIFCTADVVALVIQSIGGAAASSANTDSGARTGSNIMLAGIVFQLVCLCIYALLGAEFLIRYMKRRPVRALNRNETLVGSSDDNVVQPKNEGQYTSGTALTQRLKLMIGGLIFSALVLFIRSVYRTVELADGWHGHVIETQVYFNVLDGAMIILAITTLNFLHPGFMLRERV